MRQELRRGGNTTGFFAFQDVITSVIGIILFIALLLSLFMGMDALVDRPDAPPRQPATPQEIATLEALLSEILEMEERLRQATAAEFTDNTIEIETLRRELELLESQIPSTNDTTAQTNVSREVMAEIEILKSQLAQTKIQLAQIEGEAASEREKLADLETKLETAFQAKLAEEAKKNDMLLIPERTRTTKSPILLDVRDRTIVLQTLDGRQSQARAGGDVAQLLKGFPRKDYYVVAYFRPSTFHLAGSILDAIRTLGYELGYDMVAEEVNVTIDQGGSR